MSLPIMVLSMLVILCINIVDSFVAQINENAMTALSFGLSCSKFYYRSLLLVLL